MVERNDRGSIAHNPHTAVILKFLFVFLQAHHIVLFHPFASLVLIPTMASLTKLSANSRPRRVPPFIFAVLTVLLAWGSDALGGQGHRNGFIPHAEAHVKDPETYKYLPGTKQPLLRHYTGIDGLDEWLVVLNVSFANITDGSVPAAALYAFQFGGQIVPILAFLILEWSRHGYGGVGRLLRK